MHNNDNSNHADNINYYLNSQFVTHKINSYVNLFLSHAHVYTEEMLSSIRSDIENSAMLYISDPHRAQLFVLFNLAIRVMHINASQHSMGYLRHMKALKSTVLEARARHLDDTIDEIMTEEFEVESLNVMDENYIYHANSFE